MFIARPNSRTMLLLLAALLSTAAVRAQTESVMQAEQLLQQHRIVEAEAVLGPVLSQDPHNAHAVLLLGQVRWEEGRADESMQLFSQAMNLQPRISGTANLAGKSFGCFASLVRGAHNV